MLFPDLTPNKAPAATKVIVGMSGGVDSSVAALTLIEQGYQVEGLFMKNWDEDDGTEYCTAKEDLQDAKVVADKLGIQLHEMNFAAEYWDEVFEHFLSEYSSGRTPNPDILCNKAIKFGAFLEYAKVLGADYIATGHYAQKTSDSNGLELLTLSQDHNKDQTYFLYAINQTQLKHALFPIGHLSKQEVRQIAETNELATFNKKDSTGICFIGERRFKDFLSTYLPAKQGIICNTDGKAIGTHSGAFYYTLGQRQGLLIGGVKGASEAPWYVIGKNIEKNELTVAQDQNHPALLQDTLEVTEWNWISHPPLPNQKLQARIRHRQPLQACQVSGNVAQFDNLQRAITPGQSIVIYHEQTCLGGGIIRSSIKN